MENNTAIQNTSADIISLAVEKIKREFEEFTGNSKAKAVSSYVSTILQDFCKQDERFAEVVYRFKRTLSNCCEDVMHGVGTHISDIDVYRGAVKFYFPNSEISMNLMIEITGEAPGEDEISKEVEQTKTKPKPKKTTKTESKSTKKMSDSKPKKTAPKKKEESEYMQLSLF